MLRQGCGDADQDDIHIRKSAQIRGRGEPIAADECSELAGGDTAQIALPALEHLDLVAVDVETRYAEPGAADRTDQGQADIAKADDTDPRLEIIEPSRQFV